MKIANHFLNGNVLQIYKRYELKLKLNDLFPHLGKLKMV